MTDSWSTWVPLLVAGLSFLGMIYSIYAQRRTRDSEAAKNIVAGAGDLVERYKAEGEEDRATIALLEAKLTDYETTIRRQSREIAGQSLGIAKLTQQLQEAGMEPVWVPPVARIKA